MEQNPRPVVALPKRDLSGGAIFVIAAVAAVMLFLLLNAHRRAGQTLAIDRTTADVFASPPPLVVPPEAMPDVPVLLAPDRAPSTPTMLVPVPRSLLAPTLPRGLPAEPMLMPTPPVDVTAAPSQPTAAPAGDNATDKPHPASASANSALVFDGSDGDGDGDTAPARTGERPGTARPAGAGSSGPGTGGDDAPASVSFIGDHNNVMPTGTVIPAVLETPIDTARPGLVRAIVSRDTRGFDGRRVLVPRGSRLIGEYQADVRSGQNRVLVTWNRLIRPDGATIRLASPTADPLGGAGVRGQVHSFFFQRFASALLQSALTVGVNLASRPGNGSVIIGLPSSQLSGVISSPLQPGSDLRPKIVVKAGAALTVFVARDLDFSGVGAR